MAREFALSVVAPDRSVVEETVTSVVAPGSEGYFGVLAGHAPLIAALMPGIVEYLDPRGIRHCVYVGGGFAEVTGDRMTVLADEAARATEIELTRAEVDLENARKTLRGEDGSHFDREEAVLEVDRAIARLKAARLPR
jgi:F-type H+-transporting ATPase subunit epsilon